MQGRSSGVYAASSLFPRSGDLVCEGMDRLMTPMAEYR